jgi:hypothetical protein
MFEPFGKYWQRYRAIIKSRGNHQKLQEILGPDISENFNWRDYSIIRMPYELIPDGFMDDRQVERAKATIDSSIYQLEYAAIFCDDSSGFFKRSLIDSCVAYETKPVVLSGQEIVFNAKTRGDSAYQYVIGIDPASERDNFSIVVVELHENHSRVVYCWSTNKADFKHRVGAGMTTKLDFYGFCVRKIRDLMKIFNCSILALDRQGGGIAIEEGLHDPDKMEPGELPIWPVIDRDKPKDTDDFSGLHILNLCQFSDANWTAEANHGLKKDLEDRVLLFPMFDPVSLELATYEDKSKKEQWEKHNPGKVFNLYDTLEDCVMEIEELKNELTTIVLTRTGTGINSRDRWDTPETKGPTGKKGRLRKDRYSALIMANHVARTLKRKQPEPEYTCIGGISNQIPKNIDGGKLYSGPDWYTSVVGDGSFFRSV